jgi:hypothetical protein
MSDKARVRWFGVMAIAGTIVCASACDDGGGGTRPSDAGTSPDGAGETDAQAVSACAADESAPVPSSRCSTDVCRQWQKVEPPGAQCSNGSQYKFFVNYSETSNNVVLMFEGGGACWDYASCSGGARGAANKNGIPDTHMARSQFLNLLRRDPQNPLQDWNMVYVPYCTGDVHTGDKVATYENPDGGAALTYRHLGHANTSAVIAWMKAQFSDVPKLLVTGYSAGGIGALQNYHDVRAGLPGVQCSYLLDDSGPAFHSAGPSRQVQAVTRGAWGIEALLDGLESELALEAGELRDDAARLNTALADKYPKDRLAMTVYEMDLNFSLYSYERFFPGISEAEVHAKWSGELDTLLETYATRANLSYYVPYFRSDNCSHCVTIPPIGHPDDVILSTPWLGTDIEQEHINLRDYIELLIDDKRPLRSYREAVQSGESFSADASAKCMSPT